MDKREILEEIAKEYPGIDAKDIAKYLQEAMEKVADNRMVIQFSYDAKIVLPYSDGLKLLEYLKNAELLKTEYNEPDRIVPITVNWDFKVISNQTYLTAKVRNLISPEKRDAS